MNNLENKKTVGDFLKELPSDYYEYLTSHEVIKERLQNVATCMMDTLAQLSFVYGVPSWFKGEAEADINKEEYTLYLVIRDLGISYTYNEVNLRPLNRRLEEVQRVLRVED